MWSSMKRLDRATYWMWAVPLVLAHVILAVMVANNVNSSLGSIDTGLIIGLAYVLVGRFRDIGWPVWIGPVILIGTMFVLPFVVFGVVAANKGGGRMMDWLSLYSLFSGPVNLILLIVAGSMPSKPEPNNEIAHVFE